MPAKNAIKEYEAGGYYHIYNRGVEKRIIFKDEKDYKTFLSYLELYLIPPVSGDSGVQGLSFKEKIPPSRVLKNYFGEITLLSYCLMPNHFHLILYEHTENGISKFMGKLLTAYSMYFNKKYDRSGPLFTHPFRSEHINNDSQYMYIFSYIHLNPLSIIQKNWKEDGVKNKQDAEKFLQDYQFSSYQDFIEKNRLESTIIDFSLIPEYIKNMELNLETYNQIFNENKPDLS